MNSEMNTVAGKARNLGVNTWLVVLGISVVVLGLNFGYAAWKGGRLGGASTSASDLQVLSQQLAVQGQAAVGGDAKSFSTFKDTKSAIDENIDGLNKNFGSTAGVSGSIQTVSATWAPLAKSADQVIAR